MVSRFSLQQRLLAAFLVISSLVLLASAAGFIYARSVNSAIRTTQDGIDQIQSINKLQDDWQNISESIGVLFLTRSVDETAESVRSHFSIFEQQLHEWVLQPPGIKPEEVDKNRAVVLKLEQNTAAIRSTIEEMIRLAAEGRWAITRDMRETVFAQQQALLNDGMQSLAANLRAEVQASFDQAERAQIVSRTLAITATAAAFLIAILVGIGATRGIVHPVKQLTEATQRVTLGDFTKFVPQERSDEIGNLSRSFALMTEWLQDSYDNLEQRVLERTQELERQSLEIQVAAEIARDISSTKNVQELLNRAAELVVERFDYYHAGIFLLDELEQYAVLQAASGPASADMLARMHRLKVGEVGIVGHVAQTGAPRIALDVDLDQAHFKNPLLPETRSEIALPIKIGTEVIGVLDVQSDISGAFRESDLLVLQTLADLLAVAIQNARLIQEAEENLNELQTIYGHYSRESWQKIDQSLEIKGYQYDQTGIHPLLAGIPENNGGENTKKQPARIPLFVRDQKIGYLRVWPGDRAFHSDELRLLNDIAIRVSQSMESARLFNETQRRAENERLVRQASDHMRETLDIESVLRTAVKDIYQTFKLSQISVELSPPGHFPGDGDDRLESRHDPTRG